MSNIRRTPSPVDATFAGPGEARRLARAVDWSTTPLGPVERWPACLRTAVRLCMASPTPMAIWAGREFTFIYNDAYIPLLVERGRWAMGRTGHEVGPDVWAEVGPEFERVIRTCAAAKFEDRPFLVRRHGRDQQEFYTFILTPIQDDDGRVLGVFNVCEETTPAVQALARTQHLYRSLVDSMDVGFCVVEVQLEGEQAIGLRILDANPAFEKHSGLRDPVGKCSRELDPNHEAHWFEAFGRVALTGQPERLELPAAGLGRVFELYTFRVGEPEDRHVAVLFTDASERRRAEERQAFLFQLTDALRPLRDPTEIELTAARAFGEHLGANRALYTEIVDERVSVVARDYTNGALSIAGRYVIADFGDECRATLRRGDSLVISDVDTDPRIPAAAREAFHSIEVRAIMVAPLVKEGRWVASFAAHSVVPRVWTDLEVTLLEEVGQRTWASIERALAEQALRNSDQRKSEFLAMLSHELRNPLAPIRNSLYLLEHASQPEAAAQARSILHRQTDHLTRLVDDLLDVTRISRGKVELQRSCVDLNGIVRTTTDDLRATFEQRGVTLRVEQHGGAAWVDGDPVRLAQVLSNLLQNAVKFTPSGGTVSLSLTAAAGDQAILCIRDTGEGMDPADVERMFEPFAQATQSMARTRGGLGLGLALVKGFVEMHGGSVRGSSPGLGLGAEFVVTLPLANARCEQQQRSKPARASSRRDILVIEDNIDAGHTLVDILELQGHRVRLAHAGHTGLALARERTPEVVLCDIGLPDISGYEVAKALRADPAFRRTQLIALTGYAQPEDQRQATAAGFDVHLPKPPSLDRLAALLGSASG